MFIKKLKGEVDSCAVLRTFLQEGEVTKAAVAQLMLLVFFLKITNRENCSKIFGLNR